jgi:hypothetical protein
MSVSGDNIPKSLREVLRLSELRGPVSITFACTFGLLISLIDQYYYPTSPVQLEAKDVVSAILLVMDLGTTEELYVSMVFRMAGMIGGVALGVGLSMGEQLIWNEYKASRKVWHEDDWKLILYKSCVFAPILLTCTNMMKAFSRYAYPIVVFAVQVPTGLFAKGPQHAVTKIASAFAAMLVAVLAVIVFERLNTTALLTEANGRAITGVLRVCELAIEADPAKAEEFTEHSEEVHQTLTQAESSIQTYFQWRSLTLREKSKKDFTLLVRPLRPLFYEAYSLYWSNAQSYKASSFRADILFCDDERDYEKYFKSHRERLLAALGAIKREFSKFLARQYFTADMAEELLQYVIERELWDNLFIAQQSLRASYMEHRTECFETFAQRWNVTHFIRQTAVISLALVGYVKAVAELFIRDEDRRTVISRHLDELMDAMDELRSSEMGGLRGRSYSTSDSVTSVGSMRSRAMSEDVLKTFARSETKGGL